MRIILWIVVLPMSLMVLPSDVKADWHNPHHPHPIWHLFHVPHYVLGPWYSYWPHHAHFQSPPPLGVFPHYPARMTPDPSLQPGVPVPSYPGAVPQPGSYQPPSGNNNNNNQNWQPPQPKELNKTGYAPSYHRQTGYRPAYQQPVRYGQQGYRGYPPQPWQGYQPVGYQYQAPAYWYGR